MQMKHAVLFLALALPALAEVPLGTEQSRAGVTMTARYWDTARTPLALVLPRLRIIEVEVTSADPAVNAFRVEVAYIVPRGSRVWAESQQGLFEVRDGRAYAKFALADDLMEVLAVRVTELRLPPAEPYEFGGDNSSVPDR